MTNIKFMPSSLMDLISFANQHIRHEEHLEKTMRKLATANQVWSKEMIRKLALGDPMDNLANADTEPNVWNAPTDYDERGAGSTVSGTEETAVSNKKRSGKGQTEILPPGEVDIPIVRHIHLPEAHKVLHTPVEAWSVAQLAMKALDITDPDVAAKTQGFINYQFEHHGKMTAHRLYDLIKGLDNRSMNSGHDKYVEKAMSIDPSTRGDTSKNELMIANWPEELAGKSPDFPLSKNIYTDPGIAANPRDFPISRAPYEHNSEEPDWSEPSPETVSGRFRRPK